jgi:serine/threonine-protein phosphatase 2A activator
MTNIDLFPKIEEDATFNEPAKLINSDTSVAQFNVSVAFDRIVGFLLLLNDSVRGHTLDEPIKSSPTVQAIVEVLDVLNTWIDQVPPSTGPRRFGNVAFRQWIKRVEEVITVIVKVDPRVLQNSCTITFLRIVILHLSKLHHTLQVHLGLDND